MSKILLSISMLISGKEDMFKSLESLKYFKDAFPTEIILVDTGCSSEQRIKASQYADKIVEFKWCNDFAAARNCGLKQAHGEWFMYLDDDEWFENPQEIIHFFTSGEYREYNCASYTVRNYINKEGTMYNDSYPSRMVKLEKNTKFIGQIHEYLNPYRLPKKTFSDFVHHYGYVYKDKEDRQKHARRNLEPLRLMRKEYPGDPRWMCQLAQEYYGLEDYEETIRVCENGLEEWEKLKKYVVYAPAHVGALYAYILASLECLKRYKEEERWLEKALHSSLAKMPEMEPTVAFYWLLATGLYSNLKDYENCWKFFEKYFHSVEKYKDNRDTIENGTATITDGVYQQRIVYGGILRSLESIVRMEDVDLCRKVFYLLDWNDSRLLGQTEVEKQVVEACCSVDYHALWSEMLQTLVSRPGGMQEMYPIFLEKEIEYKTQGESAKLSRLRRLVSELDFPHKYILYTKILWMDMAPDTNSEEERKDRLTRLFAQLFEEYPKELMEIKAEVWNVADKWQLTLEPMLQKIDFVVWRRELEKWLLETGFENVPKWQERISNWKNKEDIRYKALNIKCIEGYLRNSKPPFYGMQEIERLFWQCSDAILDLYRPCYTDSAFTDTPELLPDEIQFALQLQTLRQAREQGSDREVLEALRALNDTYEPMNGVIAYYAKLYREEVHNRNNEMAQLATGLKRNVRILIGAGKLDDAKAVITQLEQFIPGDEELQAFKDELRME